MLADFDEIFSGPKEFADLQIASNNIYNTSSRKCFDFSR